MAADVVDAGDDGALTVEATIVDNDVVAFDDLLPLMGACRRASPIGGPFGTPGWWRQRQPLPG
jgi:hypothetical protein